MTFQLGLEALVLFLDVGDELLRGDLACHELLGVRGQDGR